MLSPSAWDRFVVAQANRDSEKGQKLSEMKGQDAWERGRYIEKQSWAIMPGDEKADSKVADACATAACGETVSTAGVAIACQLLVREKGMGAMGTG